MHQLKCLLKLIFHENKFGQKITIWEVKISLFIWAHKDSKFMKENLLN